MTYARRAFLGACGGVLGSALAGCNIQSDTDSAAIRRRDLQSIIETERPDITTSAPVTPDQSVIRTTRSRVETLLASLPQPIGPEIIPNGVVRSEVTDARDTARERLGVTTSTDSDGYHSLLAAVEARGAARRAATIYAAVQRYRNDELPTLRQQLRDEHSTLRPQVQNHRSTLTYTGSTNEAGVLRAMTIHANAEAAIVGADTRLSHWELPANGTIIDLGERASTLESAAATTTAWSHLLTVYTRTQSEPHDLTPVYQTVLEQTQDRIAETDFSLQGQQDDPATLIDAPVDENGLWQTVSFNATRPVERAIDDLTTLADEQRLGEVLNTALQFEHAYQAFELIRQRIETRELPPAEDVATVRTEREAALTAAQQQATAYTGPSLARDRLADTVQSIAYTDQRVHRRFDGDPDDRVSVRSAYSEYVYHRAQLEAFPTAVQTFRTRVFDAL